MALISFLFFSILAPVFIHFGHLKFFFIRTCEHATCFPKHVLFNPFLEIHLTSQNVLPNLSHSDQLKCILSFIIILSYLFRTFYRLALTVRFQSIGTHMLLLRKKQSFTLPCPFSIDLFICSFVYVDNLDSVFLCLLQYDNLFPPDLTQLRIPRYVLYSSFSITLAACSLLITIFQMLPSWIIFIRIILSNDVETNPGDFSNSFFTFCNWNLNSIVKDSCQITRGS